MNPEFNELNSGFTNKEKEKSEKEKEKSEKEKNKNKEREDDDGPNWYKHLVMTKDLPPEDKA